MKDRSPDALTLLPGYTEAVLDRDLAYNRGYFPNTELTERKIRLAMAMYYATISQIDHHVGRMVEVLKAKGLYDNTVIVYNSDHGDFMGFHHLLLKGNYMYDPLIKVPLIVKYPDQVDAGTASNALVNSVDVGPTLLKTAECEVPQIMVGKDLREGVADRDLMFAETGRGQGYMVRSHTRKLILCRNDAQSVFFDLEKDPYELENLYEDPGYAGEIAAFKERLMHWMLFECPAVVHLDADAPVIDGDNVQKYDGGHREGIYRYYEEKMTT